MRLLDVFIHFIGKLMREQTGSKIIIIRDSPNTYVFPSVTPSSSHLRHSSVRPLGHRSNIMNGQQIIKVSSFNQNCLRQCCKRKRQSYQKCVVEATAKKNQFMGLSPTDKQPNLVPQHYPKHKNCSHLPRSKRTITQQTPATPKNKVYMLPHLKTFQDQEIRERQIEHKVIASGSKPKLMTIQKERTPIRIHPITTPDRGKPDQKQDEIRESNNSYINVSLVTPKTRQGRQSHPITSQKESEEQRTNPSKRYYKYIENYPNRQEVSKSPQKKHMNSQSEEQKEIAQSFKPQTRKDNSTIFHSNKIKFSASPKMTKVNSTKFSLQSDINFKIPQTEEEQTSYLLNYKPISQNFHLRDIVKLPSFDVLLTEKSAYFGLTKNNKKQGKGILLFQKQIFQGDFADDQMVFGSQKTKDGVYRGQFLHSKRHGQGQFHWTNGQHFLGEWKNGKKQGHGIWKSPKGDFYQGEWKYNRQNGKGVFSHVGGSKYSGYFKDFLKHGRGEEQFANGDKYSGQYKNGKPHGYGRYSWANLDKYQGDFFQGSREGKGTLTKANGESYEGGFQGDQKHGEGKERYASGEWFQGDFREGEKVKGKLYNKKGTVLEEI